MTCENAASSREPQRASGPLTCSQELWAYLAIYQALRTLITRAAARDGIDPARISFTTARDAAERTLGTSPAGLHDALASAETEMLRVLVPMRQGRIWPRAKKTRSPAEPRPGPLAQHATYTVTITPPGQPAENTTDQPKQPAQPVNHPP